ncbi:MAG TPA: BamA/TamA family outer membrane protein [Niabella sp.]|nr:BamA/TamA family outer membrane protein [Niabella sp.]HOZ96224.1 BamA/TamA family outer membrane protein [Niabella sp.]HQW13589.1 BamA/TamA family outer membrane protein [Niabella sp.]HQX18983.1 BamA/TamA family outer membrane protein [Niabella sp.]HQX40488.1 BamA/TamA family outer membrane protein [Niabella sp.]
MVIVFSSCTVFTIVKDSPANKPFVFETTVSIEHSDIKSDEKARLEGGLYEQLDDDITARKLDKVLWEVLKNPKPLDSSLLTRSIEYMHYYLHGEGYFQDSISYTTHVKQSGEQERAYINFRINLGKVTRIDSISYSLTVDSLQHLADSTRANALIKKGSPFAQGPISLEFDRLVELYRNNGYMLFKRSNLYALWDTVDLSMLQPALDPLEQIMMMKKAQERLLKPTANLEIRLKQLDDSSSVRRFYVGNVTIYPDIRLASTASDTTYRKTIDNITIIQNANKFKPRIFPQYVYLERGELYKQSRYLRTLNRFSSLGSWRLVDLRETQRGTTDTVDFVMRLTPASKHNFTTNFEGSFSQSVIGDFVGLGVNFGLQNRNFLKTANQLTTSIRYGVELGGIFKKGNLIQTQQVSMSNSLIFPRLVFPGLGNFKKDFRGNTQSIFSINVANTDRRVFFNLATLNSYWGYDFSWRARNFFLNNKLYNLGIKLPNIEYSFLEKKDSLNKLIISNPSIKNLFSDGLITSFIANFSMPWNSANKRTQHVLRTNVELSGLLTGFIKNRFIEKELYRFVKVDAEYARLYKISDKTGLVLRGFGGIGYELGSTPNPDKRSQLPFFKQFYSGGPNSMRAWQLRQLGPGSLVSNFAGSAGVPDRFGDVQLEGNIEFRFPVFRLSGIPINGAAFTDIGNVWLLKKDAGNTNEVINLSSLGTDLAIGSGLGLRMDFSFLVIRLDYGYKVKDPSPSADNIGYRNKFFAYPFFKGSQLQLGIGYPFIF